MVFVCVSSPWKEIVTSAEHISDVDADYKSPPLPFNASLSLYFLCIYHQVFICDVTDVEMNDPSYASIYSSLCVPQVKYRPTAYNA